MLSSSQTQVGESDFFYNGQHMVQESSFHDVMSTLSLKNLSKSLKIFGVLGDPAALSGGVHFLLSDPLHSSAEDDDRWMLA